MHITRGERGNVKLKDALITAFVLAIRRFCLSFNFLTLHYFSLSVLTAKQRTSSQLKQQEKQTNRFSKDKSMVSERKGRTTESFSSACEIAISDKTASSQKSIRGEDFPVSKERRKRRVNYLRNALIFRIFLFIFFWR